MKSNQDRALPVILLAIFIDLVCNGILVPIVPQLLANPDSSFYLLPASIPSSYAYIILGILIAAFPAFAFFSTPILGEYSDNIGRRKVMMFALVGTAISLGLFAVGVMIKNFTLLFSARILGGIAGGYLSVAQAAIADITPPHKRAERFGLIGAAYGFGFIIGPVMGGLLSDSSLVSWFNASTPFWAAAILSLVNALLIYIYFKETRYCPPEERCSITWSKAISNIINAYHMKSVRAIFVTNFLFQAGITLFATFFSVFLIDSFGYDQVAVGYYIGYAGIWIIISQALFLRALSKRFDEWQLLRVFLFVGALTVFMYYVTDTTAGLLIVGACFALANGVSMATLPSLASRRTSPNKQGEILGINASLQSLAQVFPPILAGFLAAKINPSAPIFAAGAVIAVAGLVFIIGVRKRSISCFN